MKFSNVLPLQSPQTSFHFLATSSAFFQKLHMNTQQQEDGSGFIELRCKHVTQQEDKMHSQMPVFICWVYCSRSCWMLVLKMASLARSCCDSESSTFLKRVKLVLYRSRLSLHRHNTGLRIFTFAGVWFFVSTGYAVRTWQLSVPGTDGGSPLSVHIHS